MSSYTEEDIKSLNWREHIRRRPGMYIGKLGDGTHAEDGMYLLLKEVVDNAIDEFVMGHGKQIDITIDPEGLVRVRDYGRGIPLGKLVDCVAKMNTGAKYDSAAFKKSVGLNGVGIKAVNALSIHFGIQAWREGKSRKISFKQGEQLADSSLFDEKEPNGTEVTFLIDRHVFVKNAHFRQDIVEKMCRYYCYLNTGLTIVLNGKKIRSQRGLIELLEEEMEGEALYKPIVLASPDIELAFTHCEAGSENYYTFVNGQNTLQGGTHLAAFRSGLVETIRTFYKKQYNPSDVRSGLEVALLVRIIEPVFESQTKTKLGSLTTSPEGETLKTFVGNFLKEHLDNYLHKHTEEAEAIQKRIELAQAERKALSSVRKVALQRARKAKVHNKKLRDCRCHRGDKKGDLTTLFITEGDSASGSITKSRDVETQAVFSLRGKPLNSYGLRRNIVYENEEFNLLWHALDIEEGLENLRYNRIVIATDADVDGMHIRLLLLTFFLQFFPELIREGHLYMLQTPLFRVRNKKETYYCYDEEEKAQALKTVGKQAEITRFKGLGEISPEEFSFMIGDGMHLEQVEMQEGKGIKEMLAFYMGKNTPARQTFIIENLREGIDAA